MTKELDQRTLAKIAFALYPFVYPKGEQSVDTETLAERIQTIRRGFSTEDEFFAMVSWLGNCTTIHRIDQTPMPTRDLAKDFRAPDFLVFANYKTRVIPLLVEVKIDDENKIEWTESYFSSLKNFASTLNLPLLIAWKWNSMWLLVDCAHFQKKVSAYHLDFETAVKENLLALLFENVLIKVNENASFIIDAEVIDKELDSNDELLDEGEYTFKIKNAGFYVEDRLINNISGECSMLLFSVFGENVVRKLSGNHVRVIFEPQSKDCTIHLFDLLLTSLYMRLNEEGLIEWDQILREAPFESSGEELRKALHAPGTSQFIDYIARQVPNTMPAYLEEPQRYST